jgi:preprotein translocase subunit YajC
MRKYYYLDGPDKKGPFSEEELINLNLDIEVLVWTEGFDNWKPIKEVTELLKIIPHPPPKEILTEKSKTKKSKKVLFSFLILFFLLIISFIIVYFSIESIKTKSQNELSNRIERIFNGKSIVCDGIDYGVKGKLEKAALPKKPILKRNVSSLDEYNKAKEESIVEKFTCESGGFTFKKLKKVDNGFELEVFTSTDMVYTTTTYYYRETVQEAYNSAFNYFKEENSGCYTNGIYELIGNFEYLDNEYYYLGNVRKPSYPYSDHWWSSGEGSVYNDFREVFYKSEGWYYEIKPRERKIRENFLTNILIGSGISILVFLLLLVVNPLRW